MVLYFPHENSHLCNKIIPLFRSKKMRLFQAKDIVTLFPPPPTPQKRLVSLVKRQNFCYSSPISPLHSPPETRWCITANNKRLKRTMAIAELEK